MRQACTLLQHLASRNGAKAKNARHGMMMCTRRNIRVLSPFASESTRIGSRCTIFPDSKRNLHYNHQSCLMSTSTSTSSPSSDGGYDTQQHDEEVIMQRSPSNPHVVTLTFNRPKKANAMGKVMLSQLHDILTNLSSEKGNDVRCVILTSCSEKVFSAGADLSVRERERERGSHVKEMAMNTLYSLALKSFSSS